MATKRNKELFTASQVARYCQVDLKTIHNWVERGEIPHFRTPGRHLRFRRPDVIAFLQRFGYPLPEELRSARPRVLVCGRPANDGLESLFGDACEVAFAPIELGTLVRIGDEKPDLIVCMDNGSSVGLTADGLATVIRTSHATRHIRVLRASPATDLSAMVAESVGLSLSA